MSSLPSETIFTGNKANFELLLQRLERLTTLEKKQDQDSCTERMNVETDDQPRVPCSNTSEDGVAKSENLPDTKDVQVEYSFPTPILFNDLLERYACYRSTFKKTYNYGILGLGVGHCLSFIAYFCRYEARKRGIEVVSVGSDNGLVDGEIVQNYYSHFVEVLDITSVNANPKLESEFKTVDNLVEKHPNIAGNCVLLLIWPEFALEKGAATEIDVIYKLQPRAVLTVYEVVGMCGSDDFLAYMRGDKNYPGWDRYENKNPRLDNYSMVEIGHQVVNFEVTNNLKMKVSGSEDTPERVVEPGTRALKFKMVKLMRLDCLEEDAVVTSSDPSTDDECIDV